MSSFIRNISYILLTILLWSCFGFSIGMIGHSFVGQHTQEHLMNMDQSAHACCAVTPNATGDDMSTETSLFMHHHIDALVVPFLHTTLWLLPIVMLFVIIRISSTHLAKHRYVLEWKNRYSYLALYLRRLLRQGILHPKTY